MENGSSPVRSVERALDILDCFIDHEVLNLRAISDITGLSSSTALRILNAFSEHGYIVKNCQDKTYKLGPKILWLSKNVPEQVYDELREIASSYLTALSQEFNEDVRLFVEDGIYKLCIESIESTRELRQVVNVGTRHDLQRGAAGKVILSYMSHAQRKAIIGNEFSDELWDRIREDGYALSNGEREEGLSGIAVPIFGEGDNLLAAISMSGPTARFQNGNLEKMKAAIIKTGKAITDEVRRKL